jgi:hypothetical protein
MRGGKVIIRFSLLSRAEEVIPVVFFIGKGVLNMVRRVLFTHWRF